ncbi:exopolysaccharide biosynthesis protein [Chthonobacter rhizosphaerae]|uniref:exopolysaccharide biosynthesis protein n=1 Tax=Chthonobacter rhizosphaerae TaxID=2735553 RepID=UPI001FEA7E40|nr:exopolysaccharide biosynthesis protein [Chthonobacter rhizosphaerae]
MGMVESLRALLRRRPPREDGRRGRRRLSDILVALANDPARDRISIGTLLEGMQNRAFGALLIVFALPNAIPTPPGTSTVLGIPLIFLAAQLALGWRRPWLPPVIADRSIPRDTFGSLVSSMLPWLQRAERLSRPRLVRLVRGPFARVIGVLCLVLSLILVLPIPLGNMLPAFSICLLSIAVLERDGLTALLGLVSSSASLVLVGGVLYALTKAALFVGEAVF